MKKPTTTKRKRLVPSKEQPSSGALDKLVSLFHHKVFHALATIMSAHAVMYTRRGSITSGVPWWHFALMASAYSIVIVVFQGFSGIISGARKLSRRTLNALKHF